MQSEAEYKKKKISNGHRENSMQWQLTHRRCHFSWEKMCLQTVLYNVRTQHSTHSTTPLNHFDKQIN